MISNQHSVLIVDDEKSIRQVISRMLGDKYTVIEAIDAEMGMKSASGGGNLFIKTEKAENTIHISFGDDGPGIAEANLVHLFDPFFSTRGVGQGAGLGLSVFYGIITEHNGQIYVKSQLGKGSVFTVELPIIAEEKDAKAAQPAAD